MEIPQTSHMNNISHWFQIVVLDEILWIVQLERSGRIVDNVLFEHFVLTLYHLFAYFIIVEFILHYLILDLLDTHAEKRNCPNAREP